jgi:predicted NAD/FAD-dependent oxidoreductase
MNLDRRAFLAGAMSGAAILALSACVGPPSPAPSPTGTVKPTPGSGVPRASGFVRSAWSTDPFSRGATSFLPVGASPELREALRQSVSDRVFFAGEATSSDSPGTLNGAQSSGERAAAEVMTAASDGERIAIIGAGMAGAAAAKALTASGFDVLVFEGRERLGGRVDARSGDNWPLVVDLGPSYLSGVESSTLLDQLREADVTTEVIDPDSRAERTPSGEAVADSPDASIGAETVDAALAWGAARSRDVSLSDALAGAGGAATDGTVDEVGVSPAAKVSAFVDRTVTTRRGAATGELSTWYGLSDGGETEGGDAFIAGSAEAIVKAGFDDAEVWLSTPVTEVGYDDDTVRLKMATGESLRVDRVVVTVPLGVLQSESIAFDPPLPFAQRAAITALGVGTLEKVWLRYDEPFWQDDAVLWTIVEETPPYTTAPTAQGLETPTPTPTDGSALLITEWVNLLPLTGDAVLMGTIGGAGALELSALGDDEVRAIAERSLLAFLPASS